MDDQFRTKVIKLKITFRIIDGLKQINKAAKPDPEIFVGNPVNAFLLIKHLAKDLQNFVNILNNIEKLKSKFYLLHE